MSKIPTVKEFLKGRPWKNGMNLQERIHESMIQFAKLHVEAALESANNANLAELGHCYECGGAKYIDEQSVILNAYPLENIK